MSKAGDFVQVLRDLDIDYSDMKENPQGLVDRVVEKAKWLSAQLDKDTSASQMEQDFKKKSYNDQEAKRKATEFKDSVTTSIVNMKPEEIVNLLPMLSEVVQLCNNIIRTYSMLQDEDDLGLSKKHYHMMYSTLKTGYDAFKSYLALFEPDIKCPHINAKSGNYSGPSQLNARLTRFYVDGNMWTNPFSLAKHLGLEIKFYMDLIEMIESCPKINDDTYDVKGHKIRMVEV